MSVLSGKSIAECLNDHTISALVGITNKMILFVPESFWASIIKFYTAQLLALAVAQETITGARCKHVRRLLLSYKPWMLFIMSLAVLIRMPEAYAINVTVKSTVVSTTSLNAALIMPTADLLSLMKGNKPISIPENEVITSEDSEDYLEEDSEEDYDDVIRKENVSGE